MKIFAHLFRLAGAVLILLLLAGLPAPVRADDAGILAVQIPFGTLTGSQPLRLSGLNGAAEVEIPTSRRWQPTQDLTLVVKATYSSALDPQASSLTFSMNDRPVASLPLADLKPAGTPVTLPKVYFSQTRNRLSLTGRLSLRSDDQTGCNSPASPDRWVEVAPETALLLTLGQQEVSYSLEDFPVPFQDPDFSPQGFSEIPSVFILPDQPSGDALTSLAAAAFAFGRAQPERPSWNLAVLTRSQLSAPAAQIGNLVFIGDSHQGLLDIQDAGQDAVSLQLSPVSTERAALVIHDASPADGSRPELALLNTLSGTTAVLPVTAAPAQPGFTVPQALSFQDLGYNARSIHGQGEQSLIYRLYLPYPLQVHSAELDLVLSHSAEVAQGQSQARVYLNGSTAAAILLTDRSAGLEPVHIDLPVKFFRPGINYLRITFNLRLAATSCEPQNEAAWATVMNTSQLALKTAPSAPLPSLQDFPQPFNDLEGALLVLPDQPDQQTLERVIRLAILIGQTAQSDARPPTVIPASAFDPIGQGGRHIVMIGTPQQNPVLYRLNNLLPQPFTASGTQLAPGYGLASPAGAIGLLLQAKPTGGSSAMGLIEITRSPWQSNHRILAITGTDPSSFLSAFDRLLSGPQQASHWNGNVLAVSSGFSQPHVFTAHDPGNLPLVGILIQSINLPGLGLSLAAIAFAVDILFLIIVCIRIWNLWQATRPAPKQAILEKEKDT